jgi:DNA-binding transcriptional MerR regulator
MLEKSPEAFKTISEAAEELGVEQHVLRFWETKFTQIKPLKRRGGRRYYRPEDMDVLHRIQHLLYKQGFTIKGAKKALNAKDPAAETAAAVTEAKAATPAKRKAGGKTAPEGQFDLLSTAAPANGIDAKQRKTLENVLASLKAARKGLQSAA